MYAIYYAKWGRVIKFAIAIEWSQRFWWLRAWNIGIDEVNGKSLLRVQGWMEIVKKLESQEPKAVSVKDDEKTVVISLRYLAYVFNFCIF